MSELRYSLTVNQHYQKALRDEVYQQVFGKHLNLQYKINEISITEYQSIHTVFLPCIDKDKAECGNYYVGHGFGGSSIMYFYLITDLLKKGNVILWEIRGMGFSIKLHNYDISKVQDIQQFFIEGIAVMLQFYNHTNSSIIATSFSSYLTLLLILRRQELANKHIKEALLLSPVGVTAKDQDYKNQSICANFFQNLYYKLIWGSNLNFKSPFSLLCSDCCRDYFIKSSLIEQIQLDERQTNVMIKIVKHFLRLCNGSENLFFQLFEPNVLPKVPIEPLFVNQPAINITIVYGIDKDWVDKTGATKLAERFPDRIRKIDIEDVSHNVAFHTKTCKQLFDFILK